jgi:hypothetical protein
MSKNIIFITEQLFKERTGASNAIDGKQLFPMIKVAQDIHIQPTLGSGLYLRLQDGIDNDDLNNDEKNLIDNYITDALIWFTMSMLPMVMGYQLFSKGFLQKTSEEGNAPSRADLELIEAKYKSMAEFYNKRLIKFLQENYGLYELYLNPGSGVDVIFPTKQGYSSPFYLGGYYERTHALNGASATTIQTVYYTATGGETSFSVSVLENKTILVAMRSGLGKVVTKNPTNDTGFLQIVDGLVTLPIGDVAMAGELFSFVYR